MNHHVNAIAGRLSLRPPQRRSLGILDRITEIVPLQKGADLAAALEVIRSEFPTVTDFEREFPSLCFALAILEREATKWFKPAKGQFQIYYKSGADHLEYQPDFVAETDGVIYMLEPKARTEMTAADVVAKKDAAVRWCKQATDHAESCSGKPWKYLLIPHDVIAENVTLDWLASQCAAK